MNKLKKLERLRKKLKSMNPSIGSWMQTSDTNIAEILGSNGFDWIAIDLEHGSVSLDKLPDIFRSIELNDTIPFARISHVNPDECKKVMDSGACGVIAPNINNENELEILIESCSWPPSGSRGVGFSRANLFGKNFKEYKSFAQNPFIVAMIESSKALDNIEKILSVDGLDAILIGPYDLSASLGVTGRFDSEEFLNSIEIIKNSCIKFNIPYGIHIVEPNPEELKTKINEGCTFIPYSMDTRFISAYSQNPIKE